MNLDKIIGKIQDKAEEGARYKKTRGKPGKQIHDEGRRALLGNHVVVRYYERDSGEIFYEVYEKHELVFELRLHQDKYFLREPRWGKWTSKLGLEESDVYETPRTAEEQRLIELGAKLIDKAHLLTGRGDHFDKTEGDVRSIGRLYRQDGICVRLLRMEKNGETSPRFLDIYKGDDLVFSAELTNDNEKVVYHGGLAWTEDFLKIK